MVSVLFPAKNLTMWKRKKEIIELTKQESNHIEDLVPENIPIGKFVWSCIEETIGRRESVYQVSSEIRFG